MLRLALRLPTGSNGIRNPVLQQVRTRRMLVGKPGVNTERARWNKKYRKINDQFRRRVQKEGLSGAIDGPVDDKEGSYDEDVNGYYSDDDLRDSIRSFERIRSDYIRDTLAIREHIPHTDEEVALDQGAARAWGEVRLPNPYYTTLRKRLGWVKPTGIQIAVIPWLLRNQQTHCYIRAPTGSGKTLAYALPLHQRLAQHGLDLKGSGVRILHICANMQLTYQMDKTWLQLSNIGSKKAKKAGREISTLRLWQNLLKPKFRNYGQQLADLPPTVIVTTVGMADTLIEWPLLAEQKLTDGPVDPRTLHAVIIDEPDAMMDSLQGRRQLTRLIRWCLSGGSQIERPAKRNPKPPQIIFASATMSKATEQLLNEEFSEVQQLFGPDGDAFLPDCLQHSVVEYASAYRKTRLPLSLTTGGNRLTPLDCITPEMAPDEHAKAVLQERLDDAHIDWLKNVPNLLPLLHTFEAERPRKSVIFVSKNEEAIALYTALCELMPSMGRSLGMISGLHTHPSERLKTLGQFQKNKIRHLILPDSYCFGTDLDGITHVFNADVPKDLEHYVHRAGRAVRAKGVANQQIKQELEAITLVGDVATQAQTSLDNAQSYPGELQQLQETEGLISPKVVTLVSGTRDIATMAKIQAALPSVSFEAIDRTALVIWRSLMGIDANGNDKN
eukprot:Clim_evm48s108 gene=Clim_evmTU48s108